MSKSYMYNKEFPKGLIFNNEELDSLRDIGWVDSPAFIKESDFGDNDNSDKKHDKTNDKGSEDDINNFSSDSEDSEEDNNSDEEKRLRELFRVKKFKMKLGEMQKFAKVLNISFEEDDGKKEMFEKLKGGM